MGAGRADLPAFDAAMNSALELVLLEWRPANLRDIDDLPHDVMDLYWSVKAGQASLSKPFDWYRTGTGVVLAHLFRVGPVGPEELARCGTEREPGAVYRRSDDKPLCQRCEAIAAGKPTSVGTIGDLDDELRGG